MSYEEHLNNTIGQLLDESINMQMKLDNLERFRDEVGHALQTYRDGINNTRQTINLIATRLDELEADHG